MIQQYLYLGKHQTDVVLLLEYPIELLLTIPDLEKLKYQFSR